MKRKRHLFHVAATTLAVVLLFTSCGSDKGGGQTQPSAAATPSVSSDSSEPPAQSSLMTDSNVNEPGVYPICKEPISIKVGIVQNANVEDYKDNLLTKYYEEKGNFNLEFDFFPSKDAMQKIEVMINSGGELPEVLVGFNFSDSALLNYGSQEVFLPLENYIDTIGINVQEAFERVDDKGLRKLMTSADGSIYHLPKYNEQIGNMWSQRQWINSAWLEKLDIDMPTTTDEFYEVLKAFREKDPNGNGKPDEVPLVGGNVGVWRGQTADAIMNAFIYDNGQNGVVDSKSNHRWIAENGTLDVPYNKDGWREGLRYMHKLCNEGLLSPLTFTQDNDQLKQLVETGNESSVGVYACGTVQFSAANERKLEYVPLPPLTGPDGVCYTAYYPTQAQPFFVMTKDAKHPEAIFRWGDLMITEEATIRGRWGEPGVDWKEPGSDDVGLFESLGFPAKIVAILPWGSVQKSHWAYTQAGIIQLGVADGQVAPVDDPLYSERFIADAVPFYVDKAPKERVSQMKYTSEETDQIKEISSTLMTYVNESMARFITGGLDIEKDWDQYVNELESIGLSKYIEVSQQAYDRMK